MAEITNLGSDVKIWDHVRRSRQSRKRANRHLAGILISVIIVLILLFFDTCVPSPQTPSEGSHYNLAARGKRNEKYVDYTGESLYSRDTTSFQSA
jgi:hypothetical protein